MCIFRATRKKKSLWPASLSAHLTSRESNGGERDHRQCSSIDSVYSIYIAEIASPQSVGFLLRFKRKAGKKDNGQNEAKSHICLL